MLVHAEACLHRASHIDRRRPEASHEVCAIDGGLVGRKANVDTCGEAVVGSVGALVVGVAIVHGNVDARVALATKQPSVVGEVAQPGTHRHMYGYGSVVVVQIVVATHAPRLATEQAVETLYGVDGKRQRLAHKSWEAPFAVVEEEV